MTAADSTKIRVAMVGAGRMANKVHYPSVAHMDDVEFAGICDIDTDRLRTTAEMYGLEKRYVDYRRMIEEVSPDAVYVIGQPHIMYDIWVWCLEEGLNLFVEKPMGISVHQARNLACLADKHSCVTQVGFQRRATPMVVHLRDLCLARGPIFYAVCRFYKWQIQPMSAAYDHMMEDGVHLIDTLRWMCGGDVVRVQSVTGRVQVPDINLITALVEFDSGALGVMLNSYSSGRRIFDVEMHAPGICVEAEHEGKGFVYADGDTEGTEFETREFAGSDEVYVWRGHLAKSRDFIDCVRSGGKPQSHFGDALKTMELADMITAQALLGK